QKDFANFHIKFDNYHKTHSKENQKLAEYFFSTLKEKGYIYTKKIETIYCKNCERYLPDRFVKGTCPNCTENGQYGDICESCGSTLKGTDLINPKCTLCDKTPILKESEHYFFALSKFTEVLKYWLSEAKSDIQPEIQNQLKEWITKGLEDWCISRDAPYFGFKIPGSKKETGEEKYFYVWLDAPIGYISSTDNYCNKRLAGKVKWEDYWKNGKVHHFIGKDIVYFHYLFWPAMLTAVDIPLPKLTTHGFITVNGQKMSKSRGTFFTAKDFLKMYPAEALRFYYASHLDKKIIDIDLNFEEFKAVNNNVLVGSLGNFCYRVLSFAQKNYGQLGEVASSDEEKTLEKSVQELVRSVEINYLKEDFKNAVKDIIKIADIGNSYFQNSEVWKDKDSSLSKAKVGWCVNLARNLAILISPVLPKFSEKVFSCFNEEESLGNSLLLGNINFNWKGKLKKIDYLVEKIEKVEKIKVTSQVKEVNYNISEEVKSLGVKVKFAQLTGLGIKKKHEGIEKLKKSFQKEFVKYENKEILNEYNLIDKKTSVDSKINPNSVINLFNLIKEKGKLPQINTVVDLYNLVSAKYLISMATHDIEKLEGDVEVRLSANGERFVSLDGSIAKLNAGEVVYADSQKIIGRFSKQCKQTVTTNESSNVILVAFGNQKISDGEMDKAMAEACDLIVKFNGGNYKLLSNVKIPTFPLQMKVGKILSVKDHPNADGLYLLQADFGKVDGKGSKNDVSGKKQVVAGLKKFLGKEDLLNRKVVFCVNIKPAKIRGELSEVMILAPDDGVKVSLLDAEKSELGEDVHFSGLESAGDEITFEEFTKILMEVKEVDGDGHGKVFFEGKKLASKVEDITVSGVREGARVR
ncbi:MAG: methionine--tRNA ligase, partial [Candidatus Woesearchaeota archaeon]